MMDGADPIQSIESASILIRGANVCGVDSDMVCLLFESSSLNSIDEIVLAFEYRNRSFPPQIVRINPPMFQGHSPLRSEWICGPVHKSWKAMVVRGRLELPTSRL